MDELGPRAGVHRRPLHLGGDLVRRRRQARSSRRCTTSSAARRSCTAPRCTGCDPQDFGELQHVDGISPAWPVELRRLRAVLHEGRMALPGARQPRRGPDRGPVEQAVPVAGGLARAADPAARPTTWSGRATTRSHAPCGILLDEADRREEHLHPLHLVRRLPVPRARQVGRRDDRGPSDPRPAERDAARRRRGHCSSRPTRPGATVTGVVVARGGTRGDLRGRHRRRSRPGASNSAKILLRVGQRPAPERARPTARTRSAGTTCSTTARPWSRCRRSCNDTVFQKTLGLNDFYLGTDDYEWPDRQHPDGRQVERRGDEGRGAEAHQARAALEPRPTSPTTPSTSGSPPRTSRCPTTA